MGGRASIRRFPGLLWAAAASLSLIGTEAVAESPAPPIRVVSMNLCTDQLAMLIAAPGQLISVSYLASDPTASAMVDAAKKLHSNRGLAEEIFLLKPDLVIAGTYTTRATVGLLKRLGIPVIEFAPANSLTDVRDRVSRMGEILGRKSVAVDLIARFDADLAAARVNAESRPRTALYYANNYTSGASTLAGSVVDAAGLYNIAIELGFDGGGRLPMEVLLMAAPELIVTGRDMNGAALAMEVFSHPALRTLRERSGTAPVADRDWVCGTPFVVAAVQRLAAARDALKKGQ